MRLRQAKGVSIKGHPDAVYNGLYTHDSTYEDRAVLKNANGLYLYRYAAGEGASGRYETDKWLLCIEPHRDGKISYGAYIAAKELGPPLPGGAQTWKVKISGGKWVDRTLTLTWHFDNRHSTPKFKAFIEAVKVPLISNLLLIRISL